MEFNNKWNVIREDDFKTGLKMVFDQVADALTNTLGPYGTTTIIEKYGEHHITKDGFQVLKSINYADPILNNFLMLLFRISAQVVIQVGDGSTSSIVAANEIIKTFDEHKEVTSKYRPKELLDIISKCVDNIVGRLYTNATPITPDNNFEEIRKIAYISTNGNAEISDMIVDIYRKTNNPTIEFVESKTDETSHDIIDGYTGEITYLDTIFATRDDGMCTINGAHVLMFDHKIDIENAMHLISEGAKLAAATNKRLVVIAPAYDKLLLEHIRRQVNIEYKARGTSTVVYCRASLISNMSHIMYNDFAVMCGAQIITERYGDDAVKENEVNEYIGYVDSMEIGAKTTLIRGFAKRSEELYKSICRDAEIKFNETRKKYENMGIIDTELNDTKNRMTKLKCSMGTIRVGGKSTLEKKALYDLVEDAVRACESAYRYGYNVGGNLTILYIVTDILRENNVTENEKQIYTIIRDGFLKVFEHVLSNKYGSDTSTKNIIDAIITRYNETHEQIGYDLITDSFSEDIINSCRTDIEILRGALSVISLIETSNQYISITTHEQE